MRVEQCAVCKGEIDRSVRGGRAITCCEGCSKQWKRVAQKYRRNRYRGKCCDCGASTDGSGGYANQSKRCRPCSTLHIKLRARWTQEAIIEAIRAWHREHGIPPGSAEWRTNGRGDHPTASMVQIKFGSWSEAIRRAGYEPNPPGRRKR
jgi:hypothetical protein